jgi:DNA-binding NarL/FixJ family response regulator
MAADDLVQAIRTICAGNIYVSPSISRTVVDALRSKRDVPADPLSPREREVLQLIAEGKTSKEIANLLGVTPKTAESHRSRIMQKLSIHDVAGLVRYAIRCGLIQP